MTEFVVSGPVMIPATKLSGGWVIPNDLTAFWKEAGECADRNGCYVFCYRWGDKITPIYVGKAAEQLLRDEAFKPFQRAQHYLPNMAQYERGEFVMFFVYAPRDGAGRPPTAKIEDLEEELIEYAYEVNKDLSNTKGVPDYGYSIQGVLRKGRGKPSPSANQFRTTMGIA